MISLLRKSYSGLSKDTWILAGVTLVNRSGMMVLPFLTIYLTSAKNFTVAQAGVISSFFGLGSMFGSYTGGRLSDRFGYFPVQLSSLILGGLSCVALGWINGFIPLCIGMFITSALLDMLRPAMSSAVTSNANSENVTRSFSLIRMAVNLGAGVGPAIAGIVAGISFKWIFIGDGLTSVAAGLVLYYFFHKKIKRGDHKKNALPVISPLKNKYFVWYILLCMTYATIFFQIFCTLPLYYDQVHHLLKKQTGYLIALNGLIVFAFEMMLVFKLENTVHPRKIIIAGIFLAGTGLLILNFFSNDIVLIISMIILSFSEIFAMPFMMTVAVSKSDHTNRGRYTGIYSTAWSAAFILSPLIGTTIVTHFGFASLWWILSLLAIVTMAGIWIVVGRLMPVKILNTTN